MKCWGTPYPPCISPCWVFLPNIHSNPFYICLLPFCRPAIEPYKMPPPSTDILGDHFFRRKATLRQAWLKTLGEWTVVVVCWGLRRENLGRFWANYIAKWLWFSIMESCLKCPNNAGLGWFRNYSAILDDYISLNAYFVNSCSAGPRFPLPWLRQSPFPPMGCKHGFFPGAKVVVPIFWFLLGGSFHDLSLLL